MLAATGDRFVSYAPGGSPEYPAARYPGMEETRDAWRAAMKIVGPASIDEFPDRVGGDSYKPHTGVDSSTIERQRYPPGPEGQELWYYRARGMGHWWPNPAQMWPGLWARFGKLDWIVERALRRMPDAEGTGRWKTFAETAEYSREYSTIISRAVAVEEAQEAGKTVLQYAPEHKVAHQFRALARELEERLAVAEAAREAAPEAELAHG